MNIAGVLVHSHPQRVAQVRQSLLELAGVEVHGVTEQGRMVVTVEECDGAATGETVMRIQTLEGVLNASMIYHHYEPVPSEEEAAS